jgi:hypothetical protein
MRGGPMRRPAFSPMRRLDHHAPTPKIAGIMPETSKARANFCKNNN